MAKMIVTLSGCLRHMHLFRSENASIEPEAPSRRWEHRETAAEEEKRNIIMLVQATQSKSSRAFLDFESIPQCIEGVCALYEKKLKDLNPQLHSISYDIGDLYDFIDGLAEITTLVYDKSVHGYLPYDRQWVKNRAFQHLRKLAAPAQKDPGK